MNNIITLTQEEIEDNFGFALKLCEKGHTIKVITKDEKAVLLQIDSNTKITINRISVSSLAKKDGANQNDTIEEN